MTRNSRQSETAEICGPSLNPDTYPNPPPFSEHAIQCAPNHMPVHFILGSVLQAAVSYLLTTFASMGNSCSSSIIDMSWSTAWMWLLIFACIAAACYYYLSLIHI